MTFGEELREKRKEKGMTQDTLAEALDVSRQAVAKWEAGVSFPSTENLLELRELLDIVPDKKELSPEPAAELPAVPQGKLVEETKKIPTPKNKPRRGRKVLVALAVFVAFAAGYVAGVLSGDGVQNAMDTLLSIEIQTIVENMDMEQVLEYVETTVEPSRDENRFCVCAARLLGYDNDNLYVYVYTVHYYKGQPTIPSYGHSWYAVSLKVNYFGGKVNITSFETAEEGEGWGISMSEIFPDVIRDRIDSVRIEEKDTMKEELEARAETLARVYLKGDED